MPGRKDEDETAAATATGRSSSSSAFSEPMRCSVSHDRPPEVCVSPSFVLCAFAAESLDERIWSKDILRRSTEETERRRMGPEMRRGESSRS